MMLLSARHVIYQSYLFFFFFFFQAEDGIRDLTVTGVQTFALPIWPYRVPHVKVDATTVYTNNPVASAYRCFGSIQTCLAYEGQMDALADALHMDPLALREKNFLRKGDKLATGQALETEPMLAETMRRAWAGLGEHRARRGPTRLGRAVAASFTPYGRMCWTRDSASAWVGHGAGRHRRRPLR